MTEKIYNNKIKSYIDKLYKDNISEAEIDEIDSKLDELYEIKPVTALWYAAKARVLQKKDTEGTIPAVIEKIENKFWGIEYYLGVIECYKIYMNYSVYYKDQVDVRRLNYEIENIEKGLHGTKFIENETKNMANTLKSFYDSNADEISTINLMNMMYICNKYVESVIIYYAYKMSYNLEIHFRKWITEAPNMGYLKEALEKDGVFIILMSENNKNDCIVILNCLTKLGKKVFLIKDPLAVEVDNKINTVDTLAISIENAEKNENYIVFTPIEIIYNGDSIGDNREHIINYITEFYSDNKLSTLLCSGKLMDELCQRSTLRKNTQRLYDFRLDFCEDNMVFGWNGSYLSYISDIYDFDVREAVESEAEYDFSIVVPARNSAYTLRYTLQTCLEQDYDGSYEIVVSDNSTNGNTEVYDLITEINDDRIKYYKTPRNLHLPKSFEYAFLKAKGKFIFSVGSDDGVLPWCLKTIKEVMDAHPDDEILKWDRGFYAWPKFLPEQEHEFVIPNEYKKGDYGIEYKKTRGYLASILLEPKNMYLLPMLYINSGFRRSYLKTLLNKTGRLWDGICQDIYMGIINIAINEKILTIKYPLTIAGMANNSIGKKSNTACKDIKESNSDITINIKDANVGGFSKSYEERLMPELGSDVSSMYNCILKAIARGVFPSIYIDKILDWKKMFVDCAVFMDKEDVLIEKNVHYMRYTAAKHGKAFLKWFDEDIYKFFMTPQTIEKNTAPTVVEKCYTVGKTANGALTLDASEYGVNNIYDAVQLFAKLSELG